MRTTAYKNLTSLFFEGEVTSGAERLTFPGVVIVRWEGNRVAELWGVRG